MPTLAERIDEFEAERQEGPEGGAALGLAERIDEFERGGGAAPEGQAESPELDAATELRQAGVQRLRERGETSFGFTDIAESERQVFLGQQVGQELGEPGFEDLSVRADIGFSDTFGEKKAKFLDSYPDGDFVLVEEPPVEDVRLVAGRPTPRKGGRGGTTILFRRNQNEPFAEFDAGILEKFELLADLTDLSGDAPALAAETGAMIISGGASLAVQLGAIALGSIVGDSVKEVLEETRDFLTGSNFQQETIGEQATRIGTRAAISTVGGAASIIVTGPLNVMRGAALIEMFPGAVKAQKAAKVLKLPALLPSQVATNPLIMRLGQQAQATVATIGNYVRRQERDTVQAVAHLRDADALSFAQGKFQVLHDQAMKQIVSAAQVSKTSLTEGGTAIRVGIAEYDILSRGIVNSAYARARAIETPEFDLAPALATAREVKIGSFAPGKKGKMINLQPPTPAILREIKNLEQINPSLPTVTLSGITRTGTDQLRAIRSNLNALKDPSPLGPGSAVERATNAQANTLFHAVDRVLKNPINADPNFLSAWKAANTEAAERFATKEKLIVIEAARSETPAQIADRLAKPLQVDNIQVLKNTIPEEQFQVFQNSVATDFISPQKIDGITKRLKNLDKETKDLLMPKETQAQLSRVGVEIDKLNQLDVPKILQQQSGVKAIVQGLTDRGDTAAITELIRRANQLPPGGHQKRMIRAGVMENVFDKSVVRRQNEFLINGPALTQELKRLKDTGLDKILTPEDRFVLQNLDDVVDFIPSSIDSGTSLQAASLAAQLRQFAAEAIGTLLENIGTGRVLTNPIAIRIILGKGVERRRFPTLRLLGAALALENSDIKEFNKAQAQPPPK